MRIGKFEVSIKLLVCIGGFVVGILILLTMWRANSERRAEAIGRGRIMQAMYDDSGDAISNGIDACKLLVELNPKKTNARFYLANLLFRQKAYVESQKAFEEIVNLEGVADREKASALVGAGVAMYMGAAKEKQPKILPDVQKYFDRAMTAQKNCVDAMINTALVKMHRGGAAATKDLEKDCRQIVDRETAGIAPSRPAQEQFYTLAAMVASQNGKPMEAVAYFERTRATGGTGKRSDEGKRLALLSAMTEKNLPTPKRRELIKSFEADQKNFEKDKVNTLNSMGVALALCRDDPDYVIGPYANALKYFQRAINADTKDLAAYQNIIGLYEKRLADVAATASVPLTGFTGQTPLPDRWGVSEKVDRFPKADFPVLVELKKVLGEEEVLFKKMNLMKLEPPAKIDLKLREVSCLRRQAFLTEFVEDTFRQALYTRCLQAVKELEMLAPDNPDVVLTSVLVLTEKGDYVGAARKLAECLTRGVKSPQLDQVAKELTIQPRCVGIRPSEGRRSFGPRTLIAASLELPNLGQKPRGTAKIDGKMIGAQMAGVYGTQLLYLPSERELAEGLHDVEVSVDVGGGTPITFPTFKFDLDKQGPVCRIEAEGTEPLPLLPVFSITLSDRSGIDYNSVKVVLKGKRGAPTTLMSEGKYRVKMPKLNPPRTDGFPLDADAFQVTPARELPIGDYDVIVTSSDILGNSATETKTFKVGSK
ncbi:MAG TPA: hypothetical protein VGP72_05745 [Planctomycetota bacterium]|jgi:tetratricopeptide (TPR) repeat protein